MASTDVLDHVDLSAPHHHVAALLRWRPVLVAVLVFVGCVGLVLSVVAVAAERTVLDTDRFARTVARSLDEPAVTDAIAGVLADQVDAVVAASGALARVVPDELQVLVPVLERAMRGFVFEEAAALLASEAGRTLLVELVRLAHGAALRVVDGDDPDGEGLVVVEEGRVALNFVPLVAAILRAAERVGLVHVDRPIPEIDLSQPVSDQIEAFGSSLGADLSPTFGQLVVYERLAAGVSDPVGLAQRLLELLRSVIALLLLASLLLLGAAVTLSEDRRRGLTWTLGALATGALFALLLVRRVVAAVPDTVDDAAAKDAVAALSSAALAGVLGVLVWLIVLAVVGLAVLAASRSPKALALPARYPAVTRAVSGGLAVAIVLWLGISIPTLVVAVALVVAAFLVPARYAA